MRRNSDIGLLSLSFVGFLLSRHFGRLPSERVEVVFVCTRFSTCSYEECLRCDIFDATVNLLAISKAVGVRVTYHFCAWSNLSQDVSSPHRACNILHPGRYPSTCFAGMQTQDVPFLNIQSTKRTEAGSLDRRVSCTVIMYVFLTHILRRLSGVQNITVRRELTCSKCPRPACPTCHLRLNHPRRGLSGSFLQHVPSPCKQSRWCPQTSRPGALTVCVLRRISVHLCDGGGWISEKKATDTMMVPRTS